MLTCANCGRESPEDFAFCPACAAPLAPPGPGREIRKTVTVVFCDVTGSTALGERLDPESLRDVQTRYFEAMRAAIERHGGTVEKYIGDAVMAVFGVPTLHEDDALRAARAAVDMRDALAALNKELERDRGVTIELRIGVNTGEVVAGDVAAGQALVTGDAVNVAARLEQQATPGAILLGEATHRLVRDAVEAEPSEPLRAKGKSEPLVAWRLRDVRDVASAVARHLDSPIVGRERQLLQLGQAFDAAREDGACQLFTVLGAAGVGKSRVVEEFLGDLADGALILRGRCLAYGEGITYFPVVEAIKQAAGLADFDMPDVVEAKVCSVLEGDEHQALVCRHVSQLMGIADVAAGEETFWAIRRFFEVAARERPLVLVLDDIHWAEPTLLDLIEHIADYSRGSAILLLCMARPELLEGRSAWGGGKMNSTTISLEALSAEQSASLIENLLGSADPAADIAQSIVTSTEGNPLFVEETLAMLIDEGLVVREGARWVASSDLSEVAVPPSIQALLAARLDRLSEIERRVLESAAVTGKEFFAGAVAHLVGEPDRARVLGVLMKLVRKELVRPEPTTLPGEDAFAFRHLLIRDAAYDAIPKSQRAELHEAFADWLEAVAGEAVAEQEEIVAYHLDRALAYRLELGPADERSNALGARASSRLAASGRRAVMRGDSAAAANMLRRALGAGPAGAAERARVLVDLGDALEWVGDQREALDALDQAVALAAEVGDRSLELLAHGRRTAARMNVDPLARPTAEYRAELEAGVRELEALGDDVGQAVFWEQLASIEWLPCRFEDAERAARRAVEHARRSGDARLLTRSLATLIAAQMFGVRTPEEVERTLDDLAADLTSTRLNESWSLMIRGVIRRMTGHVEEGRRLIGLARDIAESLGSLFLVAAHEEQLGDLELEAGELEAAEAAFRRNYEILHSSGDEGHASTAAGNLARALCALGRYEEADGYATIAMEVASEDDIASQAAGRAARAMILASRGEHAAAETLAREAVQLFVDHGAQSPSFQATVWRALADVLVMAGRQAEARAAALEALALYERKGHVLAAASTRTLIEELGDPA
jgi:class 3 adenylate cyclase/tetratricopeptide (TPR) repeat protein